MGQNDHTVKLFWEQFHGHPVTKAVAATLIVVLVVVFTGKEFSLSRAIGELNYDSASAKERKLTKPAEKLHTAVVELQELLGVQAKSDLSEKQAKAATSARTKIAAQLKALDVQFSQDRIKLYKLDARDALKRLAVIEQKTAKLTKQLTASLVQVPTDGAKATVAANSANKVLTALSPEKPRQPLSSDLSFGIKNAKPRAVSLSAGITPAYNSPTSDENPSPLPRAPQPEDLAETPETKTTPAIHDLAISLGNDPVRIYEWIHNNIVFEPYYGIRKGANQTLVEKSGSAADQSALLISLLRGAGVHARFVQGVAEMPAAKLANWLAVDVAHGERIDAAAEILWSGGIPATSIRANGRLNKIRFNHVWIEAYVPTQAYRGVEENVGSSKGWLPLDPTIKRIRFVQPVADFRQVLSPLADDWAQLFLGDSQVTGDYEFLAPASSVTEARTTNLLEQSLDAMAEHGVDKESRVSDLFGSRAIKKREVGFLPSSTQFQSLTVTSESRSLEPALHSTVSFQVSGSDALSTPEPDGGSGAESGFTFTASTADLAGKRVTIAYVPASQEDSEIIDAYHGLLSAPSYAAALMPVLRVDGQIVARGNSAVATGYTQNFRITYRSPGLSVDSIENPIYVGGLSAVILDLGRKSGNQTETKANALGAIGPGTTASNVLTDAKTGRLLDSIGDMYFLKGDAFAQVDSAVTGLRIQRQLSGAIAALDVGVSYVASFPIATRLNGLNIDVDQDKVSAVNSGTDERIFDTYAQTRGFQASASESWVFETTLGHKAASTARAFQIAINEQVPFFKLTEANVEARIDELDVSKTVKEEVSEAAHRGFTVTIPQRAVSIDGWHGSGYTIASGDGSIDYRITGGISGGAVDLTFGQPSETAAGVIAKGIAAVEGGFVETVVDVARDLKALFDWANACFDALDDTVALAALSMYMAYISAYLATFAVEVGAGAMALVAAPVASLVFLVVAFEIMHQILKTSRDLSECAEPPDFDDE
jgi:hypothetical protein